VSLLKSKNKGSLSLVQVKFLLCWELITPDFGFGEDILEKDRSKEAEALLKLTELDWQNRVKDNLTSLGFVDFFFYTASSEGLKLPANFSETMVQMLKGDVDEFK
jgi:hypothetical protein